MTGEHEWKREVVFGDTYHHFSCHKERLSCSLESISSFNFCPFCGEELDG